MENTTGFTIEKSVPFEPFMNGVHHHETPKYAIEKNVPIPESQYTGAPFWKESIYPYKEMQVGDSFFVPVPKDELRKRATRLGAYCSQWGRGLSKKNNTTVKFVSRKVESPQPGIRIWRSM